MLGYTVQISYIFFQIEGEVSTWLLTIIPFLKANTFHKQNQESLSPCDGVISSSMIPWAVRLCKERVEICL